MAPVLSILTPATSGAIAVLHLSAPDAPALESLLTRTSTPIPAVNRLRVGRIADVDHGVIARFTPTTVHLMPHAGPAVVAEVVRRVEAAGAVRTPPASIHPRTLFPEAADDLEARMLLALAHAASPLAIDLLLDQPRRWGRGLPTSPQRDRALRCLLSPPTVAAYGPPNIGKSTLCNALAGRSVAIVADEAGTTRDHVGVMLDLAGLVVRYVDTPGMTGGGPRPGASRDEAAAVDITLTVLRTADLILRCADAGSPPLELPRGVNPTAGTLTLALRSDLGPAAFPHDLSIAATTGHGISELAELVTERLVPRRFRDHEGAWKFWD